MNCWLLFPYAFVLFLSFRSSNTLEIENKSKTFSHGINQFSAEFYKHLAKSKDGNFVSSPISIAMTTAMAAYGADGNTRKELVDALHLPINRPFLHNSFRNFIMNINNATDIEIHMAFKLFIQNKFPLKQQFQCITNKVFLSEIQSVDFKDATNTAKIINNWCMEETNNKITDVVEPDKLKDTKLVMVNAVYFKAKWMFPFKEMEDKIFHLSETESTVISMMKITAEYNYGSIFENTAKYVELPYKSSDPRNAYSMFIIIPNEINGLNAIGDKLHEIDFVKLNHSTRVDVYMPRFEIESNLDLKPTLKDMGIRDMFTDDADFSKITQDSDLKITDVIQKAYIKVAEKGTEAAACTQAALVQVLSIIEPEIVVVDKPFISAVVSKNSGTPLFWARVMDPGLQTITENTESSDIW